MKAIWIFLLLALVACTSAEQKPTSQWTVKATTASQQKIWVTKDDGSRQCAGAKGAISPEFAMRQLKAAGILAFQSKKGNDGQMRAQKCGAATGNTVEVEISRTDLRKALALGYLSKSETTQ